MKRFMDKICAVMCIISSREYLVFAYNPYDPTSAKCCTSQGLDSNCPSRGADIFRNAFLDAAGNFIDSIRSETEASSDEAGLGEDGEMKSRREALEDGDIFLGL